MSKADMGKLGEGKMQAESWTPCRALNGMDECSSL